MVDVLAENLDDLPLVGEIRRRGGGHGQHSGEHEHLHSCCSGGWLDVGLMIASCELYLDLSAETFYRSALASCDRFGTHWVTSPGEVTPRS